MKMKNDKIMEYTAGQKYKARVPFGLKAMKVHIEHVLEVEKYNNKLIVYRVYGKHKQYWHYFSCFDFEMDMYVKHCQ